MARALNVLGIAGAGAMGRGIAQIAAQAGVEVRIFDVQPGAADKARGAVSEQLAKLRDKGRLEAADCERAVALLRPVESLEGFAGCDLVVEAIVEQLEAKRALFAQLEGIVGDDCILATNTSSLSVTAIAAAVQRPERVAGFHFFNPVPLMKVVEVIAGALTEGAATEALADFARRLGHRPVRAKDTPGFIVNHAGRGFGTEALRILHENAATVEQIDTVLREAAGFRLGPFQLMDLTGLDVSLPVMESIYRQYYEEPRYRPGPVAAQRVAAGLLGRKTGRGFYRYDEPAVPSQDAGAAADAEEAWSGPVWIGAAHGDAADRLAALLARCGARIDGGERPHPEALCIVAPLGEDVTARVVREGLDARRTVGLDTLLGCDGHLTLMTSPATDGTLARQARALLMRGGQGVSLIEDCAGFIAQRVLATIVNIGCDIVQQGICTPEDLDTAVELGLGYPHGPLAWGDALGPARVLAILENLHAGSGDPRYRASPWLQRRALLGLSLRHVRG